MTSATLTTSDMLRDCHECHASGLVSDERTRFFPRQLVGPDDLTQDQVYFREKLRRHNRLLHGWGIVCGAWVRNEHGTAAIVSEGYVLGPYGDEIVIGEEVSIDLSKQDSVGTLDCGDPDLWCGDAPALKEGATGYLAVRYVERATRPVRVPGCGCGCDEAECEYSRTRDGFELKILTELPEAYRSKLDEEQSWTASYSCADGPRECPTCPTEPWVILCDLVLNGDELSITCPPNRRYVVSFADHAFACRP